MLQPVPFAQVQPASRSFATFGCPTPCPSSSGAKVAITLAVIGAVIGEFVGGSAGLGYIILLASSQVQTSLVFAALAILSVQGILLFYAIDWIEKLTLPWYMLDTTESAIGTGGG